MATPDPLARPVLDFLVPAVILGLLSLLFMVFPIDLVVQGWFYSIEGGWFLKDADPLMLIYKKGLWPGLLVAASAVVGGYHPRRHLHQDLAKANLGRHCHYHY